jgi:hypothetical protein
MSQVSHDTLSLLQGRVRYLNTSVRLLSGRGKGLLRSPVFRMCALILSIEQGHLLVNQAQPVSGAKCSVSPVELQSPDDPQSLPGPQTAACHE